MRNWYNTLRVQGRQTVNYKALIIEDDEILAEAMAEWLKGKDFDCDVVGRGDEAADWFARFKYDLAIVDWQIPGLPGVEVIRQYRQRRGTCSILMLTGKDADEEKEQGLDAGADDYLTKPFSYVELGARIRALLRRPASYVQDTLAQGALVLDFKEHKAEKAGIDIPLTANEFAVLQFFLRHPNEVLDNEALILRIWGSDADVTTDAIYSCIKRLRKKLGSSIIENVHGVGYKLGSVS
ncbi:MAG: response regulator transcription factor [Candidatus Obscuribacterales bacterium]|nr:response regulator transcription factor [Candidatus Obscuribacterales bacterium]